MAPTGDDILRRHGAVADNPLAAAHGCRSGTLRSRRHAVFLGTEAEATIGLLYKVVRVYDGCHHDLGSAFLRGTRDAKVRDRDRRVGGWLSFVEVWFSVLSRKCLKRADFADATVATQQIEGFITTYNTHSAHPYE